jgi:hypothetical protein
MLSPEYLAQLPEPLIKLWELVEDDILRDIGRRIRKMDVLTDTAAYQVFRLEQTRLLHTDIVKLIAKYSGKSETAIRKLLQQAAVETLRSEDAIHKAAGVSLPPINQSENLLNLLNAGYRQTVGTWQNLTATTANTVTRQFEDALDRAWLQVSSGAFDYQTAIRNAVDSLAQHMDGVTYPSGHHDSLEVAVRRATLTGVNQTCGKLQWERREQAGCEFVEVSAHSGAREYDGGGPKDHAGWQGKVYHVGGAIDYMGEHYEDFVTATGYGTGDGLCGWNCRHNYCSFWPGISTRVYTDEQLADLSAKNIEYNGKMYSRYEINQMQREKERNVRKWKKTWMIEKEAGLDTTSAAIRLRNARKSLNDFVRATGGRVNSSRLSTWNTSTLPGKRFSRSEAAKASAEPRSTHIRWLKSIGAEKTEFRSLDFFENAKYNDSPGYQLLVQYADDVESGWVSPLSGFENYRALYNQIQTDLVGKVAANGTMITGQVPHFMQRVIGTMVDPEKLKKDLRIVRRSGVDIDDIKNAIFFPIEIGDILTRKSGQRSIKLIGNKCVVTINPDTGNLIQTNPL